MQAKNIGVKIDEPLFLLFVVWCKNKDIKPSTMAKSLLSNAIRQNLKLDNNNNPIQPIK